MSSFLDISKNCKKATPQKLPYYDSAIKKFVEEESEILRIKNRLIVANTKHEKMIKKVSRAYANLQKDQAHQSMHAKQEEQMQQMKKSLHQRQEKLRRQNSKERMNHHLRLSQSIGSIETQKKSLRKKVVEIRKQNHRAILHNKSVDLSQKRAMRQKVLEETQKSRITKMSFFQAKNAEITLKINGQICQLGQKRGAQEDLRIKNNLVKIKQLQETYSCMKKSIYQLSSNSSINRTKAAKKSAIEEPGQEKSEKSQKSQKSVLAEKFEKLFKKCKFYR